MREYPVQLREEGRIITNDQQNAIEAFFRYFPEKKQNLYGLPVEAANEAIRWFNERGYE